MATTTQIALPLEVASPVAMWHLLSLDAPTVAAVWVWFVARVCHVYLPLAVPAAMAIAVWMLYVADRLLDARGLNADRAQAADQLEARHLFHYSHRRFFLLGITLAAIGLATLSPSLDPAAMRLFLTEGVLLFAWFVVLHATGSAHRLPKEVAVGLFFSAAVFIPTVARAPGLRASLIAAAILFAAVCSFNCLCIYAWEHESPTTTRLAHLTTRLAVAHLRAIGIAAVVGGIVIVLFGTTSARPLAEACVLAAGILLALHRNRRRFSRNDLRATADVALLTPLLLFPFLR